MQRFLGYRRGTPPHGWHAHCFLEFSKRLVRMVRVAKVSQVSKSPSSTSLMSQSESPWCAPLGGKSVQLQCARYHRCKPRMQDSRLILATFSMCLILTENPEWPASYPSLLPKPCNATALAETAQDHCIPRIILPESRQVWPLVCSCG